MKPVSASRARLWLGIALFLTGFKIWLTRGQGLYAIGGTVQNDRILVELARQLVEGNWLGAYNEFTLTTAPFYPLFIAVTFGIGLPLFLAQHIFYAVACGCFAGALRPALAPGARCAIYALLLWNPMTFDAPQMGRVSAAQVQAPLVLMMVAGGVALYLRRQEPARHQIGWAMLLGLAAAGFYLSGPGFVWIAVLVTLLAIAALRGAKTISRETLTHTSGLLGCAAIVAILPVLLVSVENKRHYDRFITSETRRPALSQTSGIPPLAGADFLLSFSRFSARTQPSTGSPDELNLFRDITGERLSPPAGELDVVGAAEYLQNVAKVDRLQVIGKALRPFLLILVIAAHVLLLVRTVQLVRRRQMTYPFFLAIAGWSALATALVLPIGPAELSIPAFASLYPMLLVFVSAIFWDVAAAWGPRRPASS